MSIQKLSFFMLGLALAALPAKASVSYQTTQGNFTHEAVTVDSLFVSSLTTFTASLTMSGEEYVDAVTGIEFFALNASFANIPFASVTSGVLKTTGGTIIEVVFPTSVDYGFGFNATTAASSGDNLCVDSSQTFSCNGNTFISQNGTGFIGAVSDNPSLTPLTTLYIHPQSGSADTDLQSFEIATQGSATPEAATMLLIGSGLIAIYALSLTRTRPARAR